MGDVISLEDYSKRRMEEEAERSIMEKLCESKEVEDFTDQFMINHLDAIDEACYHNNKDLWIEIIRIAFKGGVCFGANELMGILSSIRKITDAPKND